MAPGYFTDRFALINSVHGCYTCNFTNIPFQLLISIQMTLFHIILETNFFLNKGTTYNKHMIKTTYVIIKILIKTNVLLQMPNKQVD